MRREFFSGQPVDEIDVGLIMRLPLGNMALQ
jgi:hypothetical protein